MADVESTSDAYHAAGPSQCWVGGAGHEKQPITAAEMRVHLDMGVSETFRTKSGGTYRYEDDLELHVLALPPALELCRDVLIALAVLDAPGNRQDGQERVLPVEAVVRQR